MANAHTTDVESKARLYWEMKTGAETGWDYSSRWMICPDGSNRGDLSDTRARSIVPVDLNAYLQRNARLLAGFAARVYPDRLEVARSLDRQAEKIAEAMDELLWCPEDGVWYDYDLQNRKQRRHFTPSNLAPLWTESFVSGTRSERATAAVQYLIRQDLSRFDGGVPTTYVRSGEQWDLPNCWPPLEHILVSGLEKTGLPQAKELAFQIAEKRVRGAYINFRSKQHMFEKYDSSSVCKIGGGGEYDVQVGFGWSNGVVLDFLDMYGDKLRAPEVREEEE